MTGFAPPPTKTSRATVDPPWRSDAEAAALLGAVFEAAPDGIVTVDQEGTILLANAQAERLFGYQPGELIGQPVETLLPEHLWALHRGYRAGYAADPQTRAMGIGRDLVGRRRDGTEFSAAVDLSAVERDGGSLVIAIVRDATRQRELDRLKDDFVATVSHELRTPLTSIVGFVDLLLEGDAGELSETARHYLEIVCANAERLMALVNDLLDISRLEAGRLDLNRERLDLARIVRGVEAGFAPQIAAKEQSLRFDLPVGLPAVWADRDRVAQIVANLVSNAHKYTPVGGTIAVSARRLRSALRVEVADTGIGLSTAEQERLFTKFYRVDKRSSRQAGGTGLGLAITRSLVELHGGTVGVESAPGRGSTFWFTLPLARPTYGRGRKGGGETEGHPPELLVRP